jgi:hypothetical protein
MLTRIDFVVYAASVATSGVTNSRTAGYLQAAAA